MTAKSFCSFCQSAGFQAPHDHFLRETKDPSSAVVCPKLKATRCNICNFLGHTPKYCGMAKERQQMVRAAASRRQQQQLDRGAWIEPSFRAQKLRETSMQPPKSASFAPVYTGKFATLDGDLEDVLLGAGDGRETKCEKEAREKLAESMKQWPALDQPHMEWCAQANAFVFTHTLKAAELVPARSWAVVAAQAPEDEDEEPLPPVEQIAWGKAGSKWAK